MQSKHTVKSCHSFRLRNACVRRSNSEDEEINGKCYPHHTSDSYSYSDQNRKLRKKAVIYSQEIHSLHSAIYGPLSPSPGCGPVQ